MLSRVLWDGGGDGLSWLDARNWEGDSLPGITDEAVIADAGLTVQVSDTVNVGSLHVASTLVVDAGATLSVTGPSVVMGGFALADGATLLATGNEATFSAQGSAWIHGASLDAQDGAVITIPGTTSYSTWGSLLEDGQPVYLRAEGAGSRLELPNMRWIEGYTAGLSISAKGGGVVQLPELAAIWAYTGMEIEAEGTGSRIELDALSQYYVWLPQLENEATLAAWSGGTVSSPNLLEAGGVALSVDGTGTVDVGQVVSFVSGRVSGTDAELTFPELANASGTVFDVHGGHVDLPVLETLTGGGITLQGGGTASVPVLANIGGAEFNVFGGVTLAIPTATTYTSAGLAADRHLRAEGMGSRLELPNIESISTGAAGSSQLTVQANGGGEVRLPKLTRAGGVDLTLDGTGAVAVDIGQFTEFTRGRLAVSGVAVAFPQLTDASGTEFDITGVHVELPILHSLTDGQISLHAGGTASVPVLANIGGAGFAVNDGVTLSIPAATSYSSAGLAKPRDFRAEGAGSRLELPNVEWISIGVVDDRRLTVQAVGGGVVRIPKLMRAGGVELELNGTDGVVVDVAQFTEFTQGRLAISAAAREFPQLVDASGTSFDIAGVHVDLPVLHDLTGGEITVRDGGTAAVPVLSAIDGAGFNVYGGVTLTIPMATAYISDAFSAARHWQANGLGSQLLLPNVESVAVTVVDEKRLSIHAQDGGVVRVPKLTRASGVDLHLGGSGTLEIGQLTEFTSGRFEVTGTNPTFAELADANGSTFEILGSHVEFPVLLSLTGGKIALRDGGTATVPLLASADRASFHVQGGVILTLPALTSYDAGNANATTTLCAEGAGSILDLTSLTSMNGNRNSTAGDLSVEALAGGVVLLGQVPAISQGTLSLLADGAASRIHLASLTSLANATNRLAAVTERGGGAIEMPQLTTVDGVSLTLDAGARLATSQLQAMTNGALAISGITADFAGLTTLTGTTVTLSAGASAAMPVVRQIDGSSISLSDGATLTLPAVTTYSHAGTAASQDRKFRAEGTGSRLELPNLVSITNQAGLGRTIIEGEGGGSVYLPKLAQAARVTTRLDETGAVVLDLGRLAEFTFGSMTVSGATWAFTNLTDASNSSFSILDAQVEFSSLTGLPGGILSVTGAGTVSAPVLADIDGTSLYVAGGAVLTLAGVTNYAHVGTASYQERYFQADGAGSRLELPNLVSITGGTFSNNRMFIKAKSGGVIDLSQVTQIVGPATGTTTSRSIDVTADGAGSLVKLDALTQYVDQNGYDFSSGRYSILAARTGGEVHVPRLAEARGVNLVVDGTGTLSVSQLVQFTSGRMDLSGPSWTLAQLTNVDGSSFYVSEGVTLALPGVTNYDHAATGTSQSRYLRAIGAGSRLELPNLVSISGGTSSGSRIFIEANSGGVIDLSLVSQITDPATGTTTNRSIDLTADGAGSLVRLDSLTQYVDQNSTDRYSTLSARSGGEVRLGSTLVARGVHLVLDATGTIDVSRFSSFTSGRLQLSGADQTFTQLADASGSSIEISGVQIGLPALVSSPSGTISVSNGGGLSAPLLANIDGANVYATGGGAVTLPAVTSYTHTSTANNQSRYLRADGSDSRLEMPNLLSITGGTHSGSRVFIEAQAGGVIDLSQVTQIVDPATGTTTSRSIDVTADGAGSLVKLDALTQYVDQNGYDFSSGRYSTLAARTGGEVRVPQLAEARGVNLVVDGTGTLSVGQLVQFTSGRMDLSGPSWTLAQLTNVDGSSFFVNGGATLELPGVTSYNHAATGSNQSRYLQADGAGSRLELPNLISITGGTSYGSRLFIDAKSGGVIDLSQVTQILDPATGNLGDRSIDVTADGAGSLIQLDALTEYTDQAGYDFSWGSYSTLAARTGGEVHTPNLTQARGVNLVVDATGALAMGQLQQFTSGRMQLPKGNWIFPQLSHIDGSSFFVSGGATLELPGVTSYDHAATGSSQSRYVQADGAGSRLELPNLISVTGGANYGSRLFIEGKSGGVIDLSQVTQILDPATGDLGYRSIDVTADGTGSLIQLDALTEYTDQEGYDFFWGRYSTLAARTGGEVRTPNLTQARGVNLVVDATGILSVGDFDQFISGRMELGKGVWNFPQLADIGGTSFFVSGGATLELPAVTTYDNAAASSSHSRHFRAEGAGSRLELPNLNAITRETALGTTIIEAENGGVVALPDLIRAAGVTMQLDDSGAVIVDVAQWTHYTSGSMTVVGAPRTFTRLTDASDSSFSINAGQLEFPVLTNLPNGSLLISNAGTVSAPMLAVIDGTSLHATGGGILVLPAVTSYAHAGTLSNQSRYLQADGAGSRLESPNLISVTGGASYGSRLFIEAKSGGVIDLSEVTQILDPTTGDLGYRSIDVTADGAGSLIPLDALTEYTDQAGYDFSWGRYSTLAARTGGEVRTPNLTQARGVNLIVDATGTLAMTQLQQFTSGRMQLPKDDWIFPQLSHIDGSSFFVSGGDSNSPESPDTSMLQRAAAKAATFKSTGQAAAWNCRTSGRSSVARSPAVACTSKRTRAV